MLGTFGPVRSVGGAGDRLRLGREGSVPACQATRRPALFSCSRRALTCVVVVATTLVCAAPASAADVLNDRVAVADAVDRAARNAC